MFAFPTKYWQLLHGVYIIIADMGNSYLLITIDALRADHLNIYGYTKRVTSPVIDEFAKQSDVYLNAYACGVPTFLSFPSIFCSIYPSRTMYNMYLPKDTPTFVELLNNRGFRTAAFIDDNPFACSLLGYDRGFDLVNDYCAESPITTKRNTIKPKLIHRIIHVVRSFTSAELVQPRKNTERIIQDAIEFMRAGGENFFVWLLLMDTHWPFSFPDHRNLLVKHRMLQARRMMSSIPGEREYDEKTGQLIAEMYDTSIRRLDAKLKMLFDFLQEERPAENTYVFVTSDHGEEFLERGALDHQENVYQEVTHVPLIVKRPRADGPAIIQRMASLLDIPTTILREENIPIPKQYQGNSMFRDEREYAISETVVPTVNKLAKTSSSIYKVEFDQFIYAIRDRQYSVVFDRDGEYKVFDRINDPQERRQIQTPNSESCELLNILKEHQSSSPRNEMKRVKARMTKLKGLGRI